ncbi:IS3 family transposase [Secundilactobacillus sp. HBUAS58055]|uniref:IS3 family transposase n=1 Tax=Secundilactobacillus angelensis TaxID=2722706 RepID=UPI001F0F56FA|nr:IS3 family transposase [Secundilactobacillus angelensis]
MNSLRSQYGLQELLNQIKLPRATYYDQLKRIKKPDKYAEVKSFIIHTYHDSFETYGYRRIHAKAIKAGFHYAAETIRCLMSTLGLKVSIYSKHTSRYSSYKGQVGRIAPNVLKRDFNAIQPLTVFHTDVTQVRLNNGQWGYLSCITDQASGEVVAARVGSSANNRLIQDTLHDLQERIIPTVSPILHSDQGWQYQQKSYRATLKNAHITQSMSRKGNCHDNAPIESFFNLLKRECLNRSKIEDIKQLKKLVSDYTHWFNYERISMNKNGLTPVEYRNETITK